jgi:hypothetical protein
MYLPYGLDGGFDISANPHDEKSVPCGNLLKHIESQVTSVGDVGHPGFQEGYQRLPFGIIRGGTDKLHRNHPIEFVR